MVLLLAVGTAGVFFGYGWFINKQLRVAAGTARPVFPYSDYSPAELEKLYPQTVNSKVQTVRTPEQTHIEFITALKANNINAAVECCFRKNDWAVQKEFIQGVVSRGQLNLMINDLEKIIPEVVGDSKATYVYSGTAGGQKIANFIIFIKDSQGTWLIESY